MLSQDRLKLSDRYPINTFPACSCRSKQHRIPVPRERGRGLSSLATALIVAALPKCPMCLLAYAGILGSLGLGSSVGETLYLAWLQPASVLFLGLTVVLIALRARRRHGYGPAIVATVAGSAILLGKFRLDWLPMVYVGLILMFMAVLWNAWPKSRTATAEQPPPLLPVAQPATASGAVCLSAATPARHGLQGITECPS